MSVVAGLDKKSLETMTDAEFEAWLRDRRGSLVGLQLTDEQRRRALQYEGSINLGSEQFRKR